MQARAEEFYSAYDEGFGECNRYEHGWGPELAFYATCGFENYGEFAAGVNAITKIFESRLATAKLNITSHRDDILVKVMDPLNHRFNVEAVVFQTFILLPGVIAA